MEIKAYSAIQKYTADSKEVAQSTKTESTKSTGTESTTNSDSSSTDTLTLSEASKIARLKEVLGYDGRKTTLTRQEILDTADKEQSNVETKLSSLCDQLGVSEGTELTVTMDSNGNVKVSGAGSLNKQLAEQLNDDDEFTDSFSRMEANQRLIDLPDEIMSTTKNTLLDYLDGGSASQTLSQQISSYASYQNAPDSFTALIMMSGMTSQSSSFTYTA